MDFLPAESQRKSKNTGVGSLSLLQQIFQPRNQTMVSYMAGRFFTNWAIRKALIGMIYIKNQQNTDHPLTWLIPPLNSWQTTKNLASQESEASDVNSGTVFFCVWLFGNLSPLSANIAQCPMTLGQSFQVCPLWKVFIQGSFFKELGSI